MTVLDDVKLGLLLQRAGKRTRGFIGGDDVECHWGTTLKSMIQVMEKNYFAAIDFRTGIALAAGLSGILLFCAAILGPMTGTVIGWAAGLAPFSSALPSAVLAQRLNWPMRVSVLVPFIFPVLLYAMLNSAFVTLRQGGIWWRETFYTLEKLRKSTVR